ncbi:MAG: hypothetical protein GX823_03675 [Clostridiales bacterium]|nr:hypothetical protein [Clostridiales bacterium]
MKDSIKVTVEKFFDERRGLEVVRTTRLGRATYFHDGREIVADEYMTLDYGKMGTTHVFGSYPVEIAADEWWGAGQPHIVKLRRTAGQIHRENLARKAEAADTQQ